MFDINMAKKTVYIDKSGNNGFDFSKPGVSTHYIVAAVIIDTEKVPIIRSQADEIRTKYFKNGEMKSSHCTNHGKRFKILSELTKLDIMIIGVVIDKRKIYDDSNIKKFSDVFYKYLNKILYQELKTLNTDLHIFADEYKNRDFMDGFYKYIEKLFPYTLIDNNSFEFINSKKEVLIQAADFISGTLSYGYEENKKSHDYKGYYGLLEGKITSLYHWPPPNIRGSLNLIDKEKYDEVIAENCIGLAQNYIEKNQNSDFEQIIDQILILKLLLNEIYLNNPDTYFYSAHLIDYIKQRTGRDYTNHTFLSQIIAPMRDNGVIISSSPAGYKIPINSKELYFYSDKVLGQAIPMLERLQKARKRVLAITNNELDIIEKEKYGRIRDYFDS